MWNINVNYRGSILFLDIRSCLIMILLVRSKILVIVDSNWRVVLIMVVFFVNCWLLVCDVVSIDVKCWMLVFGE